MNIHEMIEKTIDNIVKKYDNPLDDIKIYLSNNKWPIGFQKSYFTKLLDCLVVGKLPKNPIEDSIDGLIGIKKELISLSENQKEFFNKLSCIIKNAEESDECNHNLKITVFLHGGGFFPVTVAPEIICLNCGLNITLYPYLSKEEFKEKIGINIHEKEFMDMIKWSQKCLKAGDIKWVDDVQKNPIKMYNDSKYKWNKPMPFEIINKKLFDSNTNH